MMMKNIFTAAIVAISLVACNNAEPANEATEHEHDHSSMPTDGGPDALYVPEGASVNFVRLQDGDTVNTKVYVQFGLTGMEVRPAGEIVKGTGHHHIIIDDIATPQGTVVPADENHIHFGGGATETELTLTPGMHTLTLQFANGIHQSYGPQMSATINIFVK